MSECGQLVIAIIMAVVAIFMLVAAWQLKCIAKRSAKAAEDSAKSMKDNIELQAKSQVLDEYSSVDMGDHIAELYEAFQDENRARETIACFQKAWKTKDFSEVHSQLKQVNNARRRVAWHYTKIYSLKKIKILNESDVKELATEEQVKDIMLGMVEKIDKPNRESGKEVYTFFRTLYPDKNEGSHKEEIAT